MICRLYLTILSFVLLLPAVVLGQEENAKQQINPGSIQWIKEVPGPDFDKEKSFFSKLGDLLFGKDQNAIVKPMSVLASSPDKFIVVDQKRGEFLEIDKKKLRNLKLKGRRGLDFHSLVGICRLPNGDLLFTDSSKDKIYQVSGSRLSVLNNSASFKQPTGIAYSEIQKEIWVIETAEHRIAILNRAGEIKRYVGKRGSGPGEFNFPTHISIDKDGLVYVLDAMNFRVQIFNPDGSFRLTFGKQGDASGYFAMPKGIAVDSFQNIYVADALFNTVQIFDRNGNYLYNFGTRGRGEAEFWMPLGLCIDNRNFIYVADTYNSRIQVFKLDMNR